MCFILLCLDPFMSFDDSVVVWKLKQVFCFWTLELDLEYLIIFWKIYQNATNLEDYNKVTN
jgi:hypothetical protein